MKQVLIVTDLSHSSPRFPGIASYLPQHGWKATIVTAPLDQSSPRFGLTVAEPDSCKVVSTASFDRRDDALHRVANAATRGRDLHLGIWRMAASLYRMVRQIIGLIDQFIWYPDDEKNWRRPALEAARKLLAERRYDALLSSSSPVTAHVVAAALHVETHLPWLADLRDLWTQNQLYRFSSLRRAFERRLEQRTLRSAATIATVSQPLVEMLHELHCQEDVVELRNGFDPLWYASPCPPLTGEFTITYTGQIYPTTQNPSLILEAVRELIDEGVVDRARFRVRFYGPRDLAVDWLTRRLDLLDVVTQHGVVARSVAIARQRESQLLLLLNWEDPAQRGIFLQKTFEYIGARRPVLATGGHRDDVREELLSWIGGAEYCTTFGEVKNALISLYGEYQRSGRVNYRGDETRVAQCSYVQRAAQLAAHLDRLSDAR